MNDGYGESPSQLDLSFLPPEVQMQYQEAYQKAIDAQQMYTHAFETYQSAVASGQEAVAQQAHNQAQYAQQMYQDAHFVYQSILSYAQQNYMYGPTHPPEQMISQSPEAYMHYPADPQMLYAPTVPPESENFSIDPMGFLAETQQPSMWSQQEMQQAYQQQGYPSGTMSQQYMQQPYSQPHMQQPYSQPHMQQPYSQPHMQQPHYYPGAVVPQAVVGMVPSAVSGSYQAPVERHSYDNIDASGLQIYSQEANQELLSGEWENGEAFSKNQSPSSWWKWMSLLIVLLVGTGAWYVYQDSNSTKIKKIPEKVEQSQKEKEELKAFKDALESEKPSRYLRELKLSRKNYVWTSINIPGKGSCRHVFLLDQKKAWSMEADIPKNEKDYLRRPDLEKPFLLKEINLPGTISSQRLVRGFQKDYLVVKSLVGSKKWILVYPVISNPIQHLAKLGKPKGTCGESGLSDPLHRKKVIVIGEGACEIAQSNLGFKPWGCVSTDANPHLSNVWIFLNDSTLGSTPRGSILVGRNQFLFGKKTQSQTNEMLYLKLKTSPDLTHSSAKNVLVGIDRTKGELFGVNTTSKIVSLGMELPKANQRSLKRIRSLKLFRKKLRIVFDDHLGIYDITGKAIQYSSSYLFGRNVTVQNVSWGRNQKILIFSTFKRKVYQFSEDP